MMIMVRTLNIKVRVLLMYELTQVVCVLECIILMGMKLTIC